ncbi:PREDICTED: methyl-CpG-binding domain-containing protein 13-like isoform X2 [Camelina sativa]|uniref:Methyl-CpG-binding domain-containing protein 13-like isoform X2 n=1 Tax=Camelina sativa TaxID=90675 RepID=A0ABM0X991_CAMSA|nr:PREDICTED: methyl-CpG-binding domain-containing protein 13-like isoform X2 [Camelina sativa]
MEGEGISAERRVEIRVRKNGRKDKVIVEKSAAKGLPEGWIKKLEITNRSSRKIRRDPFFIDPKSGYIFQSFKDASRYVETGDIGHYARKVKESYTEDDDSGNGKTVYVEKRSADDLLEKEKKIDTHVRESKPRNLSTSDEHSRKCNMNSDLSIVASQVLEDLGEKEEAKDPIETQPIVKRVTRSQAKASKNEEVVDLKRKNLSSSNAKSAKESVKSRMRSSARSQEPKKESAMKEEDEKGSTEKRITRSKAKVKTKELSNSVARRTSKRLAGIELEPTPELKTRTKVQRIVPPDEQQTPECNKTGTKAQRIIPPDDGTAGKCTDDEQTPECNKIGTKAQRITAPDDGTAGKCKQPVNPVATSGLNETEIPLNKEAAKSYIENRSQKPYAAAAATSNNRVSAEMAVGVKKIRKSVGRKPSVDKKTVKTPPIIYELNPVFHLDGYMQKEEMSPVSLPPDDGKAGKCKHPVNPVATSGLKETEIPLNKEAAKSYIEHRSQKPYAAAAATSNNRVSAEMAVGVKKIRKSVGRKPSVDKKTVKTPPIIYELNPVFHLDGYMQKEEMSPVSPLSCETSATKWEKTGAGIRLGGSSPKDKLTTSVKATEISDLGLPNKGTHPRPCDTIQRRNKLGNELSNSSVVRGACSKVMEKNTNSFSSAYNSTLADLWKDPCIAFAIKTLTGGESLHLPNTPAISSDPTNNHTEQKGVSFIPETTGNVNICSEKPSEPPVPDIWKDPCIDFAIKTLTGAIPIGLDEPQVKSKSEGMKITTMQEREGRSSNCDHLVQQCNMKNKSVDKGDLCAQSLSKV